MSLIFFALALFVTVIGTIVLHAGSSIGAVLLILTFLLTFAGGIPTGCFALSQPGPKRYAALALCLNVLLLVTPCIILSHWMRQLD